jgi:uncharacterized protein YbaR (Trm112 family)
LKVEELLDLLACPKCHHALRAQEDAGLVCENCKLFYALEDGLPNMLISEARTWPLASTPAAS